MGSCYFGINFNVIYVFEIVNKKNILIFGRLKSKKL